MPKFQCQRYPRLWAYIDGETAVQFVDGEVDADGAGAEALRALDASYEVTELKSSSGKSAAKTAAAKTAAAR